MCGNSFTLNLTSGSSGESVGRLVMWKSCFGEAVFTVILDCAADGSLVSWRGGGGAGAEPGTLVRSVGVKGVGGGMRGR